VFSATVLIIWGIECVLPYRSYYLGYIIVNIHFFILMIINISLYSARQVLATCSDREIMGKYCIDISLLCYRV
jgi:hypothetical protein